jgi:hypothetical protein
MRAKTCHRSPAAALHGSFLYHLTSLYYLFPKAGRDWGQDTRAQRHRLERDRRNCHRLQSPLDASSRSTAAISCKSIRTRPRGWIPSCRRRRQRMRATEWAKLQNSMPLTCTSSLSSTGAYLTATREYSSTAWQSHPGLSRLPRQHWPESTTRHTIPSLHA